MKIDSGKPSIIRFLLIAMIYDVVQSFFFMYRLKIPKKKKNTEDQQSQSKLSLSVFYNGTQVQET